MPREDYLDEIGRDVLDYLKDCIEDYADYFNDEDELKEKIYDDLFIEDCVTGNASGSYTFSTWQAEENICHCLDLVKEAYQEFGGDYSTALDDPEGADVTIRCYLLYEAIDSIWDDIMDMIADYEEEEVDACAGDIMDVAEDIDIKEECIYTREDFLRVVDEKAWDKLCLKYQDSHYEKAIHDIQFDLKLLFDTKEEVAGNAENDPYAEVGMCRADFF